VNPAMWRIARTKLVSTTYRPTAWTTANQIRPISLRKRTVPQRLGRIQRNAGDSNVFCHCQRLPVAAPQPYRADTGTHARKRQLRRTERKLVRYRVPAKSGPHISPIPTISSASLRVGSEISHDNETARYRTQALCDRRVPINSSEARAIWSSMRANRPGQEDGKNERSHRTIPYRGNRRAA
jgi:hypothetical protein